VMTAADPKQCPAVAFEDANQLAAGHRAQTAISITRSFPVLAGASTSTERHPSMAA
jgi:hypothetical protein